MKIISVPFDVMLPPATTLHAGSLTCLYENGNIRYIKKENTELVRMLYGAVRDADWGTADAVISDEQILQQENSFLISYTAHYHKDNIYYKANFSIEGKPDDSLVFKMNGKALSSFNTNRMGLCAHLPVKECKGRAVTITDETRATSQAFFPSNISPHQPFGAFQKIQWNTITGDAVAIAFEGDTFEAEDQRNWMDHSFKIYGRPLALPYPFWVNKGEEIKQCITLKLSAGNTFSESALKKEDATAEYFPLPKIGFTAADELRALSENEIALLHQIPFEHYRAEVDFEKDWKASLYGAASNAKAVKALLELILFFTDNYREEIQQFTNVIKPLHKQIKTVLPLHKAHKVTPVFLQEYFYRLLKQTLPELQIGYGTDAYFAELNRHRPQNDFFDFVSFSINPQVHAFDIRTLLENLQTIPDMMDTIRSFTQKPILVSPVSFKRRKNHDATGNNCHELINNNDERQYTAFGAGWFLLCLFQLHAAAQVSFFKTTGSGGIIQQEVKIPSPLYNVLSVLKKTKAVAITKKVEGDSISIILKNNKNETITFILKGFRI